MVYLEIVNKKNLSNYW